jgi:hypothetical protein
MKYNSRVSAAVAAVLGVPVSVWGAEAPADTTSSESTAIAEVTVTESGCVEFHKTERSVRTASSEQVRRPIYKEGLDQWKRFVT